MATDKGKRERSEKREEREVSTTMRPDEKITVTEREYTDLTRQGLVQGTEVDEAQGTAEPASGEDAQETPPKRERGTGGRA